MGKHVSDGEKLAYAMLNRKEMELTETRKELDCLKSQLKAMSGYIWELKASNKLLGAQVNYLVRKQINNA